MEISIILNDENAVPGIINLKKFIDKSSIDGLQSSEIERKPDADGQMGVGDILGSIKTIIDAAEKPLVELIKCLQKYVNNYRTEITIPVKDGGNIVISQGRSMSASELQKLVVAIQNSSK